MKDVVKFLSFIIYLICIFYINNIFILIILLIIHFIIIVSLKLNLINSLRHLAILLPFLIFTIVVNSLISGYIHGIFIGIRLLLAYTISYIFINKVTIKEISNAIDILLTPLSIFKIDVKQISLIISIAISILPNMLDEFEQKTYSIKSKSFKMNFNNILVILKALFVSILMRTNEFENTLIVKGYSDTNNE